jgi:Fe-S cluster biosynthesis and repair protein YggX
LGLLFFLLKGEAMTRTVKCVVLGTDAEGLDHVPYPGELGQRIYENVSKEGWQRWVKHQTMLLNEYRLTPIDPKARKFLVAEMEKFFFGGGSEKPREYIAPDG